MLVLCLLKGIEIKVAILPILPSLYAFCNVYYTCTLVLNTARDVKESNCSDGELRLSGAALTNQGRLEVCVNGVWGSVCDSQGVFTTDEAKVACRQLGILQVEGSGKKFVSCSKESTFYPQMKLGFWMQVVLKIKVDQFLLTAFTVLEQRVSSQIVRTQYCTCAVIKTMWPSFVIVSVLYCTCGM